MTRSVSAPTTYESLVRTARITGALYLALAVTGGLGFLLVRPMLFDANDPAATLALVRNNDLVARLGIALEMSLVLTQALAALWFYRLFRSVDDFAAGSIAVFGLINSVAILASAAFLGTALQVADQGGGNTQLMFLISGNFWKVGNLFFGLWLIPMGLCVLRSQWMPRALGLILVAGGVAYVLTPFVGLAPSVGPYVDVLTVPATIGELWMIGYLLAKGVNRLAASAPVAAAGRSDDMAPAL